MTAAPRPARVARRPSVASCALVLAFVSVPPFAAASPAAKERSPASPDVRLAAPATAKAVTGTRVHPLVLLGIDDERLRFSALGRDWEVELAPRTLLSPAARAALGDVPLPRLLGGRVVGDERSWVRLARSADELSGHLFADGTLHRIEPPAGEDGYRLVVVGRPPDGLDGLPSDVDARGVSRAPRVRAEAPLVSRAMRVGIVVDSRYDERSGGRGLARALGVMNGVDGLYRDQLGLAVVVDRVRVHDDPATDPMRSRGGTVEQVLTAFRDVRRSDPSLPDDLALVHLFSGHEDPDGVIGLGWIDTVCRLDGYDVSMSTPFPYDALLSAHEIAHNLGARHDEDPSCRTADGGAGPRGLMEERISSATGEDFSACSVERLRANLGASCLVDSLDLAIEVSASPGPDERRRRVAVRVTNGDPWRTARDVRTRTRFPAGTGLAGASAGCTVDGALLACGHGDVAPGADGAVTVLATLGEDGAAPMDGELVATIAPGNAVDSDVGNDRATLDLRAAGEAAGGAEPMPTGAALGADGRSPGDDDPANAVEGSDGGSGGGGGAIARLTLALLGIGALWRRTAAARRPPARGVRARREGRRRSVRTPLDRA